MMMNWISAKEKFPQLQSFCLGGDEREGQSDQVLIFLKDDLGTRVSTGYLRILREDEEEFIENKDLIVYAEYEDNKEIDATEYLIWGEFVGQEDTNEEIQVLYWCPIPEDPELKEIRRKDERSSY